MVSEGDGEGEVCVGQQRGLGACVGVSRGYRKDLVDVLCE